MLDTGPASPSTDNIMSGRTATRRCLSVCFCLFCLCFVRVSVLFILVSFGLALCLKSLTYMTQPGFEPLGLPALKRPLISH